MQNAYPADSKSFATRARLRLQRMQGRLTSSGLLIGTVFFLISLTPSLSPSTTLAQAGLSGLALAAGYGIGVLLRWLWRYLELPLPRVERHARTRHVVLAACAMVFVFALWRGQYWQDIVRDLMGVAPVETGRVFGVGLGAVVVALLLRALGRALLLLVRACARFTARHVPRRVANVVGGVGAVLLVVGLVNGVIVRSVLDMLDASYRTADSLIPPDVLPPQQWDRSGSPQSLVAWNQLGRMGRRYISATPDAATLAAFAGPSAKSPLRVYVGLPAADTPQARARLALDELKRVGGFSRAALVIITPTGTGWVDPGGIDSIEYLYRGDMASVATQYSYLSSPLTLFVDPESGRIASRALFREVYGYWRTLPKDQRPKLYLHGLSLGALNSERSFEMFELLDDPVNGALWSGPPFSAQHWRAVTAARNPGTPIWRPEFRDGSFVRFMNQEGSGTPDNTPWGPMRIMYLQYGSDAVTFLDKHALFREPELLQPPRAPDIAPSMRWYPMVTMLQMAMDLPLSMNAPLGFGHVYSPSHYLAAWQQVTGVDDWKPEDIDRLKRYLDERRAAERSAPPSGS
jgi:uncharacterized membrane protein